MAISDNYQIIRRFKNKTATEISAATGISKQNLSTWENGHSNPGSEYITRLSKYFGLPKELFYKDDLTMEYLQKEYSGQKHTHEQKQPAVEEKAGQSIYEELYEKFLGSNSEYLVIHRDVLKEHRLIPVERLEEDKERAVHDRAILEQRTKEIESLTATIRDIAMRPINIHLSDIKRTQE